MNLPFENKKGSTRKAVSMASEIRIQPPTELLTRGHAINVPVTLVLDRPLKVRGIHAKFQGAEETTAVYTTTSVDAKGVTTTHSHTAVQHSDITTQAQLLLGNERLSTLGNMSDAVATMFGGGRHEVMQPGEYKFDIEVSIPADAPATHVGKKTRVFYELTIHVDVPLGFDLQKTQSFHVAPLVSVDSEITPVRTCYPDDAGRGYFNALFTPDVRIEMALVANQYRIGEAIDGIFCIDAAKPLNCRAIRVRLAGTESSQAQGHADHFVHVGAAIELSPPGVVNGSYKQEFSLSAENAGPLTAKGKLFSIDWFVQVELDVPWAKDPTIRAPIVLLPAA